MAIRVEAKFYRDGCQSWTLHRHCKQDQPEVWRWTIWTKEAWAKHQASQKRTVFLCLGLAGSLVAGLPGDQFRF